MSNILYDAICKTVLAEIKHPKFDCEYADGFIQSDFYSKPKGYIDYCVNSGDLTLSIMGGFKYETHNISIGDPEFMTKFLSLIRSNFCE